MSRILAIDDDPVNRQLLEIYLLDDFSYKIVSNAEQALESLGKETFDMVVTDINMDGGQDGIWLGTYIKSHSICNHIPVVAFTAHATGYLSQFPMHQAFDFVIEKPIIKKQFVARLKEILYEVGIN